jgi:hypothetical protein
MDNMKNNELCINGILIGKTNIGEGVICSPEHRQRGLYAIVTSANDAYDDALQFFDLGRVFPDGSIATYGDDVRVIHLEGMIEDLDALVREALSQRGFDADDIMGDYNPADDLTDDEVKAVEDDAPDHESGPNGCSDGCEACNAIEIARAAKRHKRLAGERP